MEKSVKKWRLLNALTGALRSKADAMGDVEENSDVTAGLCMISKSPYQIIKSAATGNLASFTRLYEADESRAEFRDEKTGRGVAHYAAKGNWTNIIEFIATRIGVAALNVHDNEGSTPLHVAVHSNSLQALAQLLNRGADGNMKDQAARTPLHLAVTLGRAEAVRCMARMSHLIDGHQLTEHGRDALQLAAILDQPECASILLSEFGLKPMRFCDNGFTAVHEAARRASSRTMHVLIQWGVDTGLPPHHMMSRCDSEGNMPLHLAVHSGDIKAVKLCLDFGAKISCQQRELSTPVHLACIQGSIDTIRVMFESQPDEKWTALSLRDSADMTPVQCAAKFNHCHLLRYLSEQGADMDMTGGGGGNGGDSGGNGTGAGSTSLMLAADNGSWRAVAELLMLGAKAERVDSSERSFLHYYVMRGGSLEQLTLITQHKYDAQLKQLLDQQDVHGCTALHYAALKGHIGCADSLIGRGACCNVKSATNESPLHLAARHGRYNTARLLLDSSQGQFIMNAIDSEGRTPLHLASEYGHNRVVQLLLHRGALVMRDFSGLTALHAAAVGGFTHTASMLLHVHAQLLDVQDKSGRTALHVACGAARVSMVTLLLDRSCQLLADGDGVTAVDLCIKEKLADTARAMFLNHLSGRRVLNNLQGEYQCKVTALIEAMPSVLHDVMDQQITCSNCKKTDAMFSIRYDFSILEPSGDHLRAMLQQHGSTTQIEPLLAVNLMVKHGRIALLMHPLTQKYLEMKWKAYGRFFHLLSLFLYAVFVVMVTVHSLNIVGSPWVRCQLLASAASANNTDSRASNNTSLIHDEMPSSGSRQDECRESNVFLLHNQATLVEVCTVGVLVFGALNMLRKLGQIYSQRWTFVREIEGHMELCLYAAALYSASSLLTHLGTEHLVIMSSVAVFFAWFNLLLYLRSFDTVGLYVVMFLEILKTMLRVLVVFSVLLNAFALAFYICMSQGGHPEFSSVPLSMVRVFNMMLGEMDFLTVFVYPWTSSHLGHELNIPSSSSTKGYNTASTSVMSRSLPFAGAAFAFIVVFMVMVPLLLMNLLVGLAVGDIEAVRKNAALKRLAMLVDVHTGLEKKLPAKFLHRVTQTEVFDFPNAQCHKTKTDNDWCCVCRKLASHVISCLTPSIGSNSPTYDHLESAALLDKERQRAEMEKLKQRMKQTLSTLDSTNKLVRQVAAKLEVTAGTEDDDNTCSDDEHATVAAMSHRTAAQVPLRRRSVLG